MNQTIPDTDQSSTVEEIMDAAKHAMRMAMLRNYRDSIARIFEISSDDVTIALRLPDRLTIILGLTPEEIEAARAEQGGAR
jgi:hypothetical protein